MKAVRFILLLFIYMNSTFSAECGLRDEAILSCDKNKRVKSLDELNQYLVNYGEANGVYRNLVIDFNIDTINDLNIHSPCKIIFKRLKDLKT